MPVKLLGPLLILSNGSNILQVIVDLSEEIENWGSTCQGGARIIRTD